MKPYLQQNIFKRLTSANDTLLLRLKSLSWQTPYWDILALVLITSMAALAAISGINAEYFANADACYPVQIQYFSFLEYRPPPSNNIFPDVLMHALLQPWITDLLTQKLTVGIIIFTTSATLIGLYKGSVALLFFLTIYSATGFYHFDSTAHFSLPLCMLLYLIAKPRPLKYALLFVGVFSDLLMLLPLTVYFFGLGNKERLQLQLIIITIAAVLNVLYSEFSASFIEFMPVLILFVATTLLARRWGLVGVLCLAICTGLPLLTATELLPDRYALDLIPGRYAVATAASIMLLFFPTQIPQFNWRIIALPLVFTALFLMGFDTSKQRSLDASFDCLAETLQDRGITAVAADHWTAKPLYFAQLQKQSDLTITQVDFNEGDIHLWMAPYAFHGRATTWAVRNQDVCDKVPVDAKYCNQKNTTKVLTTEPMCNIFELIQYAQPVPLEAYKRPENKFESILFHLGRYIDIVSDQVLKLL